MLAVWQGKVQLPDIREKVNSLLLLFIGKPKKRNKEEGFETKSAIIFI